MESNAAAVRAYLAAIEGFDVDAMRRVLHPDVEQVEHPNKLYPNGQARRFEQLINDLPRGTKVLREQKYAIRTLFGSGDMVVVETRWEGVLKVPLAALQPGEPMVAHVCMVFTLMDGKIVRQVNYDCYEDFSAAA